jgi:hypothetical protein
MDELHTKITGHRSRADVQAKDFGSLVKQGALGRDQHFKFIL